MFQEMYNGQTSNVDQDASLAQGKTSRQVEDVSDAVANRRRGRGSTVPRAPLLPPRSAFFARAQRSRPLVDSPSSHALAALCSSVLRRPLS